MNTTTQNATLKRSIGALDTEGKIAFFIFDARNRKIGKRYGYHTKRAALRAADRKGNGIVCDVNGHEVF